MKTSEIQLSCDTCDSKKAKTPVMRACAYARGDGFIGIFTIQFPRFSICTFPCRSFPLHCVLKNEPLLLTKRHVVSPKTTRCFSQNDTLFSLKQHVVFPKTSRRFISTYTSIFIEPNFLTMLHSSSTSMTSVLSLNEIQNGGIAKLVFAVPPLVEN